MKINIFFESNNVETLVYYPLGPREAMYVEALASLVCYICAVGVFILPMFCLEQLKTISIPSIFVVLGTIG